MAKRVWKKAEIAYLKEHYASTATGELAAALNKSRTQVIDKAHKFGLHKNPGVVEMPVKNKAVENYREETPLMADIVCFMHRRGLSFEEIGRDLRCPPMQAEDIVERCMRDGMYEEFRRKENSSITSSMTASWTQGDGRAAVRIVKGV